MTESIQHKLDRVRPPRVQITYDVEIGNAIEKKELPFIVGIMADLSGMPESPLPKVKDRKFVEIDRDNFNDVMGAISPRLEVSVPNEITGEGKLRVALNFKNMDDLDPMNIVQQIEPLRLLHQTRQRLSDLLTKLDGNDDLDLLLQKLMTDPDSRKQIRAALEQPKGDGAAAAGPAAGAPAAPADEPK